jgi:PHP family Zn ribbon phosphoesterase
LTDLPNIFIPCEEKASAKMCKRAAQHRPITKQDVQYKVEELYNKPNQDKDNIPPYKSKEWLIPLCFIPHFSIKSGNDENKIIHKETIYDSTIYK